MLAGQREFSMTEQHLPSDLPIRQNLYFAPVCHDHEMILETSPSGVNLISYSISIHIFEPHCPGRRRTH